MYERLRVRQRRRDALVEWLVTVQGLATRIWYYTYRGERLRALALERETDLRRVVDRLRIAESHAQVVKMTQEKLDRALTMYTSPRSRVDLWDIARSMARKDARRNDAFAEEVFRATHPLPEDPWHKNSGSSSR